MTEPAPEIGIVAIGRNEAENLQRCLLSAGIGEQPVAYVDSGSTDGSIAIAERLGAEVIELDTDRPFSAARARNAGYQHLLKLYPDLPYIQFVDADCEIVAGWLDEAASTLSRHRSTAAVCGRRREREPEQSVFNRLCDLEWDRPCGIVASCGGDAMYRAEALVEVGGFDATVVAGEEPELCHRLGRAGWQIRRVNAEMTLHDARMTRVSQWWQRAVRSGLASAEAATGRPLTIARKLVSTWAWALGWPVLTAGLYLFWGTAGLWMLAAPLLLLVRIALRQLVRRGWPLRHCLLYAAHCWLAKWPEAVGHLRWLSRRLLGRRQTLVEYR
ncbi:MAG: glycosyltransferase family 2 protein [Phycisphaeraceae bacterium]|nr:glycosyltransferase family 2 protein [Phycisphaeraceae bacterium]